MTVVNPKSISGINSITMASGSDNLLTIHTTNTTERVRVNSDGDVIVGSGITVSPDGDIFATGVTTSTTFSGNFSGGTVSGTTGTFSGAVSGTTGTFSGAVSGTTAAFTGNLSITNTAPQISLVDSDNNSDFSIYGAGGVFNIYDETNSASRLTVASDGTVSVLQGLELSSTLTIPDTIVHSGDTNTKIRFPAADTVSVETAGSERFRFASDGVIHVNSSDSASGGRIWANSSALYLQSGNGRQTIKVSDASAGVNRTIEMTSAGNLAFPSGNGIDFSATGEGSNTSGESELFDDYEYGSCSILIHDAAGSNISVTGGNHKYNKIGNKVFVEGSFTFAESGSKNGGLMILYQLPYVPAQAGLANGVFWYDGNSDAADVTGIVYIHNASNGQGYLKQSTTIGQNSNNKYLTFNEIQANSSRPLYVSFCYIAA